MTYEELKKLFKETSFKDVPLEIKRIEGKDSDSVLDSYADNLIFYQGASKAFADCQRWADAKFIKAVTDFFAIQQANAGDTEDEVSVQDKAYDFINNYGTQF